MIDDTYESLSQSVVATNVFCNNIVELISTGNYWAQGRTYDVLMHTWYVGLLMQFYLVFPVLFLLARLDKNTSHQTLTVLMAVLATISFFIYLGDNNDARKFYLLPARFFEFSVGGIVALRYNSLQHSPFGKWFVHGCYAFLILLLAVNTELVTPAIKLLAVIAVTCVLLCSQDILENKITGNSFLAKIGVASYSIFVWHQIALAFYRQLYGSQFSVISFLLLMIVVAIVSWMSYLVLEKKVGRVLKTKKGKLVVLKSTLAVFVVVNGFSLYVYMNAGVMRDIPELGVEKKHPHRGMWAEYNDRIFNNQKPFETDKLHWLVIGNSYGRDFANIIYEAGLSDQVEVSYCNHGNYQQVENEERFRDADKIFIASKGYTEEFVHSIEILAMAFGHTLEDVVVVGEKYFGETMTQVYARRFRCDYKDTGIKLKQEIIDKNTLARSLYGNRFIDLLSMSERQDGLVRAFTDDGMFISSDCSHLTRTGAQYFAKRIDWDTYLNFTSSRTSQH